MAEVSIVSCEQGPVSVTFTDRGEGRVHLLLHGGGGSATVTAFADRLAETSGVRVVVPIHPGFDGTDRPEQLTSIADLAGLYAALLDELDLRRVTVIGNSIGGWIAAELGLLVPQSVSRIVLVDAVGIEVPGHPVADFFSLTPAQVAEFSYADPRRFGTDPATLSPDRLAVMKANREALSVYGGSTMTDATLSGGSVSLHDGASGNNTVSAAGDTAASTGKPSSVVRVNSRKDAPTMRSPWAMLTNRKTPTDSDSPMANIA